MKILAALLVVGAALAGCADEPSNNAAAAGATTTTATYPMTLQVPGAKQPLVIKAEPQRIAVLSPDAATAVDELVGTSRIVAIPNSSKREATSVREKDFASIANVIPDGINPDPEQVLSWNPDLVVVTARHTGEKDASTALTAAGVPTLTLTNNWGTPDQVAENITLIGRALNAQTQAAKLVAQINSGVNAVKTKFASTPTHPSVLIMPNMGGKVYVSATDVLTSALIDDAGGVNASVKAGIAHTMPTNPEQVVAANPDMIMLIDVMGTGQSSFNAILGNPAVKNLPAVRQGKVKLFSADKIYGIGGVELVDGLQDIAAWLHP